MAQNKLICHRECTNFIPLGTPGCLNTVIAVLIKVLYIILGSKSGAQEFLTLPTICQRCVIDQCFVVKKIAFLFPPQMLGSLGRCKTMSLVAS